jgi:pimeloyl-ACP methyl ester carboxylesterase
MQETRVKVDQIELQIREFEHVGEAVIFLHFGGANLLIWERIVPFFQPHYRLILVDIRGHGRSDQPESGYHIDEMAHDIVGIMHHLKIEKAHIVGSSLGAEIGLSVAANYPEKVISLVCDGASLSEFGPYSLWEGSEAEFENFVSSQIEVIHNRSVTDFPSVDALVEARRVVMEKYAWNQYIEEMERYGTRKLANGRFVRAYGKQAIENYMNNYYHCRFEDYYKRVKCPLLMVVEEDLDDPREKDILKKLAELAVQAQIVEIKGWMHPYGWLIDPDQISKVIMEFLGRVTCTKKTEFNEP